jgi:D-tyrosyl-tRNA(Tyr) deacylase
VRAVVQRVREASVQVDGDVIGAIGHGLVALIGCERGDTDADMESIASKLLGLRVFEDDAGKMQHDVVQAGGSVLVISQFTLLGDCRKGRRPSFVAAEAPETAAPRIARLADRLREAGVPVATGRFGADMQVGLVNDGPVTLLLDSRKTF